MGPPSCSLGWPQAGPSASPPFPVWCSGGKCGQARFLLTETPIQLQVSRLACHTIPCPMTKMWGLQASDPRESIAVCCRLHLPVNGWASARYVSFRYRPDECVRSYRVNSPDNHCEAGSAGADGRRTPRGQGRSQAEMAPADGGLRHFQQERVFRVGLSGDGRHSAPGDRARGQRLR